MGRHNGIWVPAHEGALEHHKVLRAAKVLERRLAIPPECAPAIVFTSLLRLEQHVLKQGESGATGFMHDGQVGSVGFPEASWAAKGVRKRPPEEVGKALREALRAGGLLEGSGADERIHDFRDHCRHIISDRERKRVRDPDKPDGGLPRTDEPDHVADSVGHSRGIPSKAPPFPGTSAEPPRRLPGTSAEPPRNGKAHGNGKVVTTPLGAELFRVCRGRRDACEVAAKEALLTVPGEWALGWAQRQEPGEHRSCFEMRRRMEEAFVAEHPEAQKAPRDGKAQLRLEDDPGWYPATWPFEGESAPDYASRAGLSRREAEAGIAVARRRGGFAPRVGTAR